MSLFLTLPCIMEKSMTFSILTTLITIAKTHYSLMGFIIQ